jgi:hypothetical protein
MGKAATLARARLERPYAAEHDASVRAVASRGVEPPSFGALLRWFVDGFAEELPPNVHASGVEWAAPGRVVRRDGSGVTDPGGGNALGSPRFDGTFRRRVLEGRSSDTEHPVSDGRPEIGEAYSTPIHQTIAYLDRRRPLIASWLRALGRHGGDWRAVGQLGLIIDDRGLRIPIPDEYAEEITRGALRLCWLAFREEPSVRVA